MCRSGTVVGTRRVGLPSVTAMVAEKKRTMIAAKTARPRFRRHTIRRSIAVEKEEEQRMHRVPTGRRGIQIRLSTQHVRTAREAATC